MLSRPSFRSAFIFSINALILCDLSLTSFHLAECVYTLVCAVVQKYYEMFFIYVF